MINLESEYDDKRGAALIGVVPIIKKDYEAIQELSEGEFDSWYLDEKIGIKNGQVVVLKLTNCRGYYYVPHNPDCLPPSLLKLESLEILEIGQNHISGYSEALEFLKNIKNLKYLDFPCSKEICLPDSISGLKNLRGLRLYYGSLIGLPESLGELVHLEYIYAQDNKIRTLPKCLERMPALKNLIIYGNSLDQDSHYLLERLKNKRICVEDKTPERVSDPTY
jgi:hypothetical protein